jgi:hypothetical protein
MKIKPWPSETFVIHTSLSVASAARRLAEQTEPKKWFRFSNKKPFQGEVAETGFRIERIIGYRNSFLPVVQGTFKFQGDGTVIEIRMRLNLFVAVFMCIWFGFVVLGIGAITTELISGRTKMDRTMAIPFGMLIFGWALVSGGFWFEARKQKKILIAMFEENHEARDDHD